MPSCIGDHANKNLDYIDNYGTIKKLINVINLKK